MKKNRKKFADLVREFDSVVEVKQSLKSVDDTDFKGDIYLNYFIKISEPYMLDKGLCIQDTRYKWLEFYDYTSKVRLTAIYDEKNQIVEWYFDIAKEIGKENGIPFEDDMYLDVVLTPKGDTILLDEDELKDALDTKYITKEEYENAYLTAKELMQKIEGKVDKIKEFTDKYLQIMLGDNL